MRLNRQTMRTLSVAFVALVIFFFPWRQNIEISGIIRPRDHVQVFIPASGRVVEMPVKRGEYVQKGEPILIVESPELDYKIQEARLQAEEIAIQLKRVGADLKPVKKN